MLDDRLTILVTLRDRPLYTLRLLRYLNKTKFPYQLVFSDGGKNKRIQRLLENGSAIFKNISFKYLRFQFDDSYIVYYKKILQSCMQINTRYVLLADNDNFMSIFGIDRALNFLDVNHEYSGCQGFTIGFRLKDSHGNSRNFYGDEVIFSSQLNHYMLNEDNPINRLERLSKINFSTFYCIQKTEDLTDAIKILVNLNPKNLNFFEVFLQFFLVSKGKIACLNFPYLFRQFNVQGSSNDENSKINGSLHDYYFMGGGKAEFASLMLALKELNPTFSEDELISFEKLSIDYLDKILFENVKTKKYVFIKKCISKNYFYLKSFLNFKNNEFYIIKNFLTRRHI